MSAHGIRSYMPDTLSVKGVVASESLGIWWVWHLCGWKCMVNILLSRCYEQRGAEELSAPQCLVQCCLGFFEPADTHLSEQGLCGADTITGTGNDVRQVHARSGQVRAKLDRGNL